MTTTDMDQATLQPPEANAPPPLTRRPALPRAWSPMFQTRAQRRWIATLAAAVLVCAVGVGLIYMDDSNNQNTVHSLTLQNESLSGRNQIIQDQLKSTQSNLTATLGELATTKAELAHPNLLLWNVPQQISGPTAYLAGGIPDTFTYHLKATSTRPMSVSILTLEQWASAIQCADIQANVNYCLHHSGTVLSWLSVTTVNFDFHDAEGCADYLAVFTAAAATTVNPNVSVTYNPAPKATGTCA